MHYWRYFPFPSVPYPLHLIGLVLGLFHLRKDLPPRQESIFAFRVRQLLVDLATHKWVPSGWISEEDHPIFHIEFLLRQVCRPIS